MREVVSALAGGCRFDRSSLGEMNMRRCCRVGTGGDTGFEREAGKQGAAGVGDPREGARDSRCGGRTIASREQRAVRGPQSS